MPHYKTLLPQIYFGAYSLDGIPSKSKVIEITEIYSDKVTGDGGVSSTCVIAKLKGAKPIILNATKRKVLIKMSESTNTDNWIGLKVLAKVGKTLDKKTKEMVECVDFFPATKSEINEQPVKKEKEKISDERFSNALAMIGAGSYTKERMLDQCILTEEQNKNLDDYIKALTEGSDFTGTEMEKMKEIYAASKVEDNSNEQA